MGGGLLVHTARSQEAGHTDVTMNTARASPSRGWEATSPAHAEHRMQSKSKNIAWKTKTPSEARP